MQKPEKIFLHHPNLMFALTSGQADKGSLRESFFINQASAALPVSYAEDGDFKMGNYTFEVGGKSKKSGQIKGLQNVYVVADDIEIGHREKIPLWLFGFFY